MSIIKSISVGNGDMFYIKHGSSNFTIIDCNIDETNKDESLPKTIVCPVCGKATRVKHSVQNGKSVRVCKCGAALDKKYVKETKKSAKKAEKTEVKAEKAKAEINSLMEELLYGN